MKFNFSTSNIELTEQASAPATPVAGELVIYAKTDKKFYTKDDTGSETQLGAGGGSAPLNEIMFGTGGGTTSDPDLTFDPTTKTFQVSELPVTPTATSSPVQVGTAQWISVAAGSVHSLAIKDDSTLWAWGHNLFGSLGLGDNTDRDSPTQVGAGTWSTVTAGQEHSLAIKSDGTLWAWGDNGDGELGDGTTTTRSSPVQIGADTWNMVAEAAESRHALAIKSDGTLWSWGRNAFGQLGQGDSGSPATNRSSPTQIGVDTWSVVAEGADHSLAIKSDGTLWTWGVNGAGELGDSSLVDKSSPVQVPGSWVAIAGGNAHSLGIQVDGSLWAWGLNSDGELGDGTTGNQSSPIQIGTSSWTSVAAGPISSLAIRLDGALFAWGYNGNGQLGLGDTTSRSSPVQVGTSSWSAVSSGTFHTLAIKTNSRMFAWGNNGDGQLGLAQHNDRAFTYSAADGSFFVNTLDGLTGSTNVSGTHRVSIFAPNSTNNDGGSILLQGGDATSGFDGGNINIVAGTGSGTPGSIILNGLAKFKTYSETSSAPTIGGGTLTLDLTLSTAFNVALDADVTTLTITPADVTANKMSSFLLILTGSGGAHTVSWGASVKWAGGTPPSLTTNGVDVFTFFTVDAGTTWYGSTVGLAFA